MLAEDIRAVCNCKFVFLYQLTVKTGDEWHPFDHYDVFFCSSCLKYRKVKIAESVKYGDGRTERRELI